MPLKAVLSLLYYTNKCRSNIDSINPLLKFAVVPATLGLINNKNGILYSSKVSKLIPSVVQHLLSSAKYK